MSASRTRQDDIAPSTARRNRPGRAGLRVAGTALLIGAFLAVNALSLAVVGCSSDQEQASTTTQVTASSQPERLVVGGKTKEEYEASIPDLQAAVDADPEDLGALQDLAVAQYNTGRYEEAAATYQKMLQIEDDPFTHNNYGNVLRDWKKTEEAKAEYETAIAGDPSMVVPYLNLASVLAAERNVEEAVKVLDEGLTAVTGEEDLQRLQTYKDNLTTAK